MKKPGILFWILVMSNFSAFSQNVSAEQRVFASQGLHFEGSNFEISYTIGELALVNTATGNNSMLTQGFHQPDKFTIVSINNPEMLAGATVYPNPADQNVTLEMSGQRLKEYVVDLYDASGRKVSATLKLKQIPGTMQYTIPLTGLSAGTYVIRVISTDGLEQRSFRINKLHI